MSLETQCLDLFCKTCGFRVSHDQCTVNGTIIITLLFQSFQYSCEWSSYYAWELFFFFSITLTGVIKPNEITPFSFNTCAKQMKMFRWCPKKNPDAVKAVKIHIKTFLISPALDSEAGFYFLLLAGLRLQDTSSSLLWMKPRTIVPLTTGISVAARIWGIQYMWLIN